LKEEHPDLFNDAKRYEKTGGDKHFTWSEGRTLDDIAALREKHPLPIAENSEGCAICHL
jgi:hypothetical protein